MNHPMCAHNGEEKFERSCEGCRYKFNCPLNGSDYWLDASERPRE